MSAPRPPVTLQIAESLGRHLQALGVSQRAHFDCGSALGNYILGVAGQNAAHARLNPHDRSAVLEDIAARWAQLDPDKYPIMRQVATQLPEHDDRRQFLVGIDLILASITTVL
jgi:hypothetical protein